MKLVWASFLLLKYGPNLRYNLPPTLIIISFPHVTRSLKCNIVHTLCTRVSDEHIYILNFIFLRCSKAEI